MKLPNPVIAKTKGARNRPNVLDGMARELASDSTLKRIKATRTHAGLLGRELVSKTDKAPFYLSVLDRDLIFESFEVYSLVLDDNKDRTKFNRMMTVCRRLNMLDWEQG